jgi:hypothetical protein
LSALNCMRGTVADYAWLVSPEQALFKQCQVETGCAKASYLARILLKEWKLFFPQHEHAFEQIKQVVSQEVTLRLTTRCFSSLLPVIRIGDHLNSSSKKRCEPHSFRKSTWLFWMDHSMQCHKLISDYHFRLFSDHRILIYPFHSAFKETAYEKWTVEKVYRWRRIAIRDETFTWRMQRMDWYAVLLAYTHLYMSNRAHFDSTGTLKGICPCSFPLSSCALFL